MSPCANLGPSKTKLTKQRQDSFVHKFLMPDERQKVFSDVGVLIYVFDITHRDSSGSSEGPGEYLTYGKILSELQQFSPTVKVYVLIHKMDLVIPILREEKYNAKALQVQKASKSFDPTIFASSIWDQSLYKAWAEIIHDLVPNLGEIEKHLSALGTLIEAEEVLLFERTSFLVVSSWASSIGEMNPTKDRFERLSNIIKNFKQTISGFTGAHPATEQFDFWDLKMSVYSLFVIKFTTNTYLAVVLPPGEARFNAAVENVKIASTEFEHLDTPVRKKLHRGPASNGMEQ